TAQYYLSVPEARLHLARSAGRTRGFAAAIRSDDLASMLGREDIRVEVGDPLLALLRDPKIAQRISDIRSHLAPEEVWIVRPQIGGTPEVQDVIHSRLAKFIEQGGCLAQIVDIRKLADQICCPQQSWKIVSRRVQFVLGNRKPGVLDIGFDLERIEMAE